MAQQRTPMGTPRFRFRWAETLACAPRSVLNWLADGLPKKSKPTCTALRWSQATDLFGREREEGLAALLGNLDQSVFGEPAYPTVES